MAKTHLFLCCSSSPRNCPKQVVAHPCTCQRHYRPVSISSDAYDDADGDVAGDAAGDPDDTRGAEPGGVVRGTGDDAVVDGGANGSTGGVGGDAVGVVTEDLGGAGVGNVVEAVVDDVRDDVVDTVVEDASGACGNDVGGDVGATVDDGVGATVDDVAGATVDDVVEEVAGATVDDAADPGGDAGGGAIGSIAGDAVVTTGGGAAGGSGSLIIFIGPSFRGPSGDFGSSGSHQLCRLQPKRMGQKHCGSGLGAGGHCTSGRGWQEWIPQGSGHPSVVQQLRWTSQTPWRPQSLFCWQVTAQQDGVRAISSVTVCRGCMAG